MTDPCFCTELDTVTAMNGGTVAGGSELLPDWLVHVLPHVGLAVPFSKPLNASGARPPLIGLCCCQCEPQKCTVALPARFARSPITNPPPSGNWNGVQISPTPSPSRSA